MRFLGRSHKGNGFVVTKIHTCVIVLLRRNPYIKINGKKKSINVERGFKTNQHIFAISYWDC